MADDVPVPRALASLLETKAMQLFTLFILQIQADFQENENKSISKLIAYDPEKYINRVLGQRNLRKIVGLLELFACDFIKEVCGQRSEARFSLHAESGRCDDGAGRRQRPAPKSHISSVSDLRHGVELPYLDGNKPSKAADAPDTDRTASELLGKKMSSDEFHYYQRLLRSILAAFALEDGADEHQAYIRRLKGERLPLRGVHAESARSRSQFTQRQRGLLEARS